MFHLLLFLLTSICSKTVYFIRHGEKPLEGHELNTLGWKRANCLVHEFGSHNSVYKIVNRIIAQPVGQGKHSMRSIETALPLAKHLDIKVELNCYAKEFECVYDSIKSTRDDVVLVVWEHKRIRKILREFIKNGDLEMESSNLPRYPKNKFDLVWTLDLDKKTLNQGVQSCESSADRFRISLLHA